MLSVHGRKPAAVVVEPVARGLLRMGLTPNIITVLSTAISITLVVCLIPAGHFIWAALLVGLFTAVDMIDGTMARLRGGGTKFGATLDATCDRITDGALFAAIAWWLVYSADAHPSLVAATLAVLISSQVISYIKARGEASGFQVDGGLIERPERLIIALAGLGIEGFGVPHALEVSIWVLLAGSVLTVGQRFFMVYNSPHANDFIAPPTGATEAGEK